MQRATIHLENPHGRVIHQTASSLKRGELVVYPTDTVYGVGCSILQKSAIEKLYTCKGKSKFDSMSILCHSIQQVAVYAQVSNFAFRMLKRLLPGPYTVILAAKREIPKRMLTRRKEIGVRVVDNEVCLQLIRELGHPLVNASASSGENPFDDYYQIEDDERLNNYASLMLDAGPLENPMNSTVIRIADSEVEIIREGKGDLSAILS